MRRWTVAAVVAGLMLGCAGAPAPADSRDAATASAAAKRSRACKPRKRRASTHNAGNTRAGASTVGRPTPLHAARKRSRRAVKRRQAKRRCERPRRRAATPRAPGSADPGAPAVAPAPSTPSAPQGSAPEEPGGPVLPEGPAAGSRAVQVQSGEYYLRLSRSSVTAGDVRVEFDNTRGEDPHDLKLVRSDGSGAVLGFDALPSGGLEAKTFRLGSGSWRLFCALSEHAERGMTANLRVTKG